MNRRELQRNALRTIPTRPMGLRRLASAFAMASALSLSASSAFAADYSVSQWVSAQLSDAYEQMGEKKYKAALETLQSARERGKLSPYEEGRVSLTEGYVYSSQSDYKRAAAKFEKALATKAMPDNEVLELHYNLGQLYQVQQSYKKALVHLLRWVSKVKSPKGRDLFLLATTYYQAERKDGALKWARRAIGSTSRPKEEWLNLVSSILFEKKAYRELPPVLERLATLYPKKEYYDRLFVVLVKNGREREGLAALELSYRQGFLQKPEEVRNLAMMYIGRGVPLKGAALLEKELKSGLLKRELKTVELLSDCYLAAKELKAALGPLARAAKLSSKGDFYLRMAEIHVTHRDWEKAQGALNKALAKGKLSDRGSAYLLLGIANYRLKKVAPATGAFTKALKHKRSRGPAKQWLNLIKARAQTTS